MFLQDRRAAVRAFRGERLEPLLAADPVDPIVTANKGLRLRHGHPKRDFSIYSESFRVTQCVESNLDLCDCAPHLTGVLPPSDTERAGT